MYQPLLEELGLTPNEAKIYETLVERGESSVSDISVAAKIHRRNVYDAIQRLTDKGLCFQIISPTENHYNAVNPNKLMEIIAEKQQKLAAALPQLKKKFQQRLAPEEAYMYRGYEGQKNIWREIIRVGEDCWNLGAKAQWFDPKLAESRATFFKEANKKNLSFRLLFDNEVKTNLPEFPKTYPAKHTYRFLPKTYSTNSIINIFGDYTVMYTGVALERMNENTAFFVIRSKNLANSYRTWFEYLWHQSSEGKR